MLTFCSVHLYRLLPDYASVLGHSYDASALCTCTDCFGSVAQIIEQK